MAAAWQALILAVSSTLDDLGVGFSIGLQRRIPLRAAAIVASLSGLTMIAGMGAGRAINDLITGRMTNYLSATVFFAFALWFIREGARNANRRSSTGNEEAARNQPDHLQPSASILLGLGLGINSLGLGISGGMAGYPAALTTALTAATSFLFIWCGARFGATNWVRNLVGGWGAYCSAALMVLLGMLQIM